MTETSIHDQIIQLFLTVRDVNCWQDRTPDENALLNALNMGVIGLQTAVNFTAVDTIDRHEYTVRCTFDVGLGKSWDYKMLCGTVEQAKASAARRCEWATHCPADSLTVTVIDSPQLRSNMRALHGLMDNIKGAARRAR